MREPVYQDPEISVVLRSEKRGRTRGGARVRPSATVSALRVAHVLARIDVRMGSEEGGERTPAFATAALYKVGEEVARAFSKATPDQMVIVKAIRQEKRFGIFHARYLTSFAAWMRGDDLVIHLSRVEWQIPKEDEETIPEVYVDRVGQTFKVLPAEGIVPSGDQELAADWRNPVFRDATHVKVGADGKLLRRQVLMEGEAPAEESREPEPAALPADLPAETLRALAELQERRTRGEISETTYHRERRDLLRAVEDGRKKPPPAQPQAAPKVEPKAEPKAAPPDPAPREATPEPDYGPLESRVTRDATLEAGSGARSHGRADPDRVPGVRLGRRRRVRRRPAGLVPRARRLRRERRRLPRVDGRGPVGAFRQGRLRLQTSSTGSFARRSATRTTPRSRASSGPAL